MNQDITANYLKSRFQDGDLPTGQDFADLIDATYELPAVSGHVDKILKTDGVSSVMWADAPSGGGVSDVLYKLNTNLYGLTIPVSGTVTTSAELTGIPTPARYDFVEVTSEKMVYVYDKNIGDGWTSFRNQFYYRFVTDPGGVIYQDGVSALNLSAGIVGDWHDNQVDGIKYILTNAGWEARGTKDRALPMYMVGSNNENILHVFSDLPNMDYGRDMIMFSSSLADLTTQPVGKKLAIQFDSGPNALLIDFGVCNSDNLLTHSFLNDDHIPNSGTGLTLKFGKYIEFIQNRSIEDGDTNCQWLNITSEYSESAGAGWDGWGNNPALSIAGNTYQRFTLSEAQYNWLVTTSGIS